MIWQFEHGYAEPRYWIDEVEGRKAALGRGDDSCQQLSYQTYRLVHRSVASSTNERTIISTILPKNVFFGHSMYGLKEHLSVVDQIYMVAILNSYVFDYYMRQQVTSNLTLSFMYQAPMPRLTLRDKVLHRIVERAAHLICTTPEFDDLAREVGLKPIPHPSHLPAGEGVKHYGVTEPLERARLRAELDGLIAHLYGLTEAEFAHILTTFPIVAEPVKVAALNAYRDVERSLVK